MSLGLLSAIFILFASFSSVMSSLMPAPLLELQFQNGTSAMVFGKCSFPLTNVTCPFLHDEGHIEAIVTAVGSIVDRFEGESCICLLEKSASIVSCTCGDGLLPRPRVIPWTIAEELWQPRFGFINVYGDLLEDGALFPASELPGFAHVDFEPCLQSCKLNPKVDNPDLCYAECMSRNAKKLTDVWDFEERNTETLLKGVNDQLGKVHYEEHKDELASTTWVRNLLEQRYQLVAHLNATVSQYTRAMSTQLFWMQSIGELEAAEEIDGLRKAHSEKHRAFMDEQFAHLQDDVLKERVHKADEVLLALRAKYVKLTGETIPDPKGDLAAFAARQLAGDAKKEVEEKLDLAEAQLAGAQGAALQQGFTDALTQMISDNGKEVARLRGELLKFAPMVIESAALHAKVASQEATLAEIVAYRQIALMGGDSMKADSLAAEEEDVKMSIREAKAGIIQLSGSKVPEGTLCAASAHCGITQLCVKNECLSIKDGSSCDVSAECGNGMVCVEETCSVIFDGAPCGEHLDCGNAMVCVAGTCSALFPRSAGGVMENARCSTADECGRGQHCIAERCMTGGYGASCKDTSNCGNGAACLTSDLCDPAKGGSCCLDTVPGSWCTDDSACGSNQVCFENSCADVFGRIRGSNVPLGAVCESGYDCGSQQFCKEGFCERRKDGDKCKPGWSPGNGQRCDMGKWATVREGSSCITAIDDCGGRMDCVAGTCRALYAGIDSITPELGAKCGRDEDCGIYQACSSNKCLPVVANSDCVATADCGNGQQCIGGGCSLVAELLICRETSQCGNNQLCVKGKCRSKYGLNTEKQIPDHQMCSATTDCGFGHTCSSNSTCSVVKPGSLCSSGCGNGQTCKGFVCVPVQIGTECSSSPHTASNVTSVAADFHDTCGLNQVCSSDKCRPLFGTALPQTAAIPDGGACASSTDCGAHQMCAFQKCKSVLHGAVCKTPSDPALELSSPPCGNGQRCFARKCHDVPDDARCEEDSECGYGQLCAESRCRAVYGIASRICAVPVGQAVVSGATDRLDYCMEMSKGSSAYEVLSAAILHSGAVTNTTAGELVATPAIYHMCMAGQAGAVVDAAPDAEVDEDDLAAAFLELVESELLPEPLLHINLEEALSSESDKVTFQYKRLRKVSHDFPGDVVYESLELIASGATAVIANEDVDVKEIAVFVTLSTPSTGCLLSIGNFHLSVNDMNQVVVEFTWGDKLRAFTSTAAVDTSGAVALYVGWKFVEEKPSVVVIAPHTQWKPLTLDLISSAPGFADVGVVIEQFTPAASGRLTLGGGCSFKSPGAVMQLLDLTVFDSPLSVEARADFMASLVTESFILDSLVNMRDQDVMMAALREREEIAEDRVMLLTWKALQVQSLLRDGATGTESLMNSVDALSLEAMRREIVHELYELVTYDLDPTARFTGSAHVASVRASASRAARAKVKKHLALAKDVTQELVDATLDCVCEDKSWQSIMADERILSHCHAHLIGDAGGAGSSCKASPQCGKGLRCSWWTCIEVKEGAPCKTNEKCGNGQRCVNANYCMTIQEGAPCEKDDACGANQVCLDGGCELAFGPGPLATRLRNMIDATSEAKRKLNAEAQARLDALAEDLAAQLKNIQNERNKLMEERNNMERAMAGAAAVRKGKLEKQIEQTKKLIDDLKRREEEMRELQRKNFAFDQNTLDALRKETELRLTLEKQLSRLQEMVDAVGGGDGLGLFAEPLDANITANGNATDARHTGCCGQDGDNTLWESERDVGFLRGSPAVDGVLSDDDLDAARLALCKKNATAAAVMLSEERSRVEDERRKWEETVVRLARPKTCRQLLGLATGGASGLYTVFPPDDESAARSYGGVQVFCDMTTDGGGWTLIGYAEDGVLGGKLGVSNGDYKPLERTGSANVNALWMVQASSEVSLSWSTDYLNGVNSAPTGGVNSYQKAVKFHIPNPESQTLNPELGKKTCSSPSWTPVKVDCIVGSCDFPKTMYTGTDSLGACSGHAYGLVTSVGDEAVCDWSMSSETEKTGDTQAIYLAVDETPGCHGISDAWVTPSVGGVNRVAPSNMAIWIR